MKNIKNKKGFTLIELLAVIVIMGILLMIAIPAMTRYMENARKDTFVDTAKSYSNAVADLWASDGLTCGGTVSTAVDVDKYYYVPFSSSGSISAGAGSGETTIDLIDQGGKSSWGGRNIQGYVLIHVTASGTNRKTKFYVAMSDGTHGIPITSTTSLVESSSLARGNVQMSGQTYDKILNFSSIGSPTKCVEN